MAEPNDSASAVLTNPAPGTVQPTSTPLPAPTPSAAAPPISAQPTERTAPPTIMPAKPGAVYHNLSHSLIGGILGALAGPPEPSSYSINPDTGQQTANMPDRDTRGSQLRRIARSALAGLAAGSQVPPQKSGLAAGLAGAGAGYEGARQQSQKEDILKREQASKQFEEQQQAKLTKMQVAHNDLELLKLRNEIATKSLEDQQKFAGMGADLVDSMLTAGNGISGQRDMSEEDAAKFMQSPDHLNYTKILSKVDPKVDEQGNQVGVNRYWTMVDLKKPVELTQSMISHLQQVNFPGSDKLNAGDKVDPRQFNAIYWNGLKQYNQAALDPKNKDVIDTRDAQGNPVKAVYNKALNTTEILRDEQGNPLSGKVETKDTKIYDPATNKSWVWLYDAQTGKFIKRMGEATTDIQTDSVGDYTKQGEDFIRTLPPQMQDVVRNLGAYNAEGTVLGRGGAARTQMIEATMHAFPGWKESEYPQRLSFMKQWNDGSGGDGASIRRMNTAFGHLAMLDQAKTALQNGDIRFWNKIANELGFQAGASPKIVFEAIARKGAAESAGAQKGGSSPTDAEISSNFANFSSDGSPKQIEDLIKTQMGLLKTQNDTLEGKFTQTMGQTPQAMGKSAILPANNWILEKYLGVPNPNAAPPTTPTGVTPNSATPNPQSGQAPQGADQEVWVKGQLTGHVVNNKYVPLAQGK